MQFKNANFLTFIPTSNHNLIQAFSLGSITLVDHVKVENNRKCPALLKTQPWPTIGSTPSGPRSAGVGELWERQKEEEEEEEEETRKLESWPFAGQTLDLITYCGLLRYGNTSVFNTWQPKGVEKCFRAFASETRIWHICVSSTFHIRYEYK